MDEKQYECAALSLKAISHPLRLKMLCILGHEAMPVHDLADRLGSSQSNVSHHLATLRDQGVLIASKQSKNVYYAVADQRMVHMVDMLYQVFCAENHSY